MPLLRSLIIFFPLLCAAASPARPARHYSYSGSDPAQWTSSPLEPRAPVATAAPADFTAFPCGATNCTVARVITDANRNSYVVGSRYLDTEPQSSDVFVAKLDPAGATVFLATLSGKGSDQGLAIALDPSGNIVIAGSTTSPNFPLRNSIQTTPGTGTTGFVVKLGPDGSQLIYSTYFGGSANSSTVKAVAVDSAGNTWVTGQTGSKDFTTTTGMPAGWVNRVYPSGTLGAFIAKLAPAGGQILASGIVSGEQLDCGNYSTCSLSIRTISGDAIALDSAGNAYVAGNSAVMDLPATQGALVQRGLGGWVARFNAAGTKLDYLTYLGAGAYGGGAYVSAATSITALAVDAAGNAYLTGATSDPAFPTTAGALETTYDGPANPPSIGVAPPSDTFIAKLNPQGTAMVYSTFLGGSGADVATGIALDSTGAAYVTGTTASSDFPVTVASAGQDFIAVLNPAGSALTYSSLYPAGSVSQTVAVDADGRVRVAGPTGLVSSLSLTATPGTHAFGITSGAGGTLGPSVAPGEVVSLYGTHLGPATGVAGTADSSGMMPTKLAGTQVLFDGVAAPLLYVSQYQINAVAPFELLAGKSTTIRVIAGSSQAPDLPGVVIASRPEIFATNGYAAAVNQDGTVNSASNPAKPGSIVSIWATGVGSVYPASMTDGQVATEAQDYGCCSVAVPGNQAEVLYAGAAPGMVVGVVQINFRLPANLGGVLPVSIAKDGVLSSTANIYVGQ